MMRGLLTYWEGQSWLHRRNPAVKLLSLAVLMVTVTLAFDVWTPLLVLGFCLGVETLLGGVPLKAFAKPLLLVMAFSAFGFVGSNAFFYAPPAGRALTILWHAGAWSVSLEGLQVGVALSLRVAAIVMCSVILVTTTDPTDLVLSLIQQGRFPYRLGYGILVAYRFLPLWQAELETIRAAHRIRGIGERATLRGRWEQLRRYAVPLLAGAIRKAERVSVAMDSKAFGALPRRTYYRRTTVSWRDWAMLGCTLAFVTVMLLCLARAGLLYGFGVVPEA